ncbi:MAG: ATP-dependent Clp protease ATP-binding subunit [Bacteroidales bacterium]|nr:ATP-dependent Clp protease ATP-binding subunit [Bacteroidales bacterium]
MNNNLTDYAKQVLTNGSNEALRLQSTAIDTGHLVLGMLRIKSCTATQIISKYVNDLSEFKDRVDNIIKSEDASSSSPVNQMTVTPMSNNAARVLQLAFLESLSRHHPKVGTRHLLAGILRLEPGNTIRDFLEQNNITLENIRNFETESDKRIQPDISTASIEIYMQGDAPELLEKFSGFSSVGASSKSRQSRKETEEESQTRYLDNFGKDLSLAAEKGELDPIVGREDIIERVAQILSRRKKNNPILVGEAGVGKSAIAEGLALHIAQKKVPYTLAGKRIFTLDIASVVAGTKYRGQFEERLKGILNELQKNKDLILFIDEIHTMIGAGNAEGGLDASNILKPALARGEIQCIGATTNSEYRKYFEKDSALERRFQKVLIEPTTVEQTIEILHNIKDCYEQYHKVKYTDEAVKACVTFTDRYINDKFLPDKAIDAMDEAGSRSHVKNIALPEEMVDLSQRIERAEKDKQKFVNAQQYEQANAVKNQIAALQDSYNVMKQNWEQHLKSNPVLVTEDDIAGVISSMTGIPVDSVSKDERKKLLDMESVIKKKVIGQDEAISKICKAIRRSRTGLKDPNRPIGSFIFVGPTGVGKTYLAKTIAEYLFSSADSIIRIDMSEYMDKINVSRLIGAAPGYVGYEESGQLTEQVRLHPYSIVLFDEIEKAHKDVFNLLLQVLDEGRLTDSMGRTVDFRNTIIVMTSNVGSRTLQDFGTGVGFSTSVRQDNNRHLEQNVIDKDIQKTFAPEFLNRIDDIVFFNSLTEKDLFNIVDTELQVLRSRTEAMGFTLTVTNGAKQHILDMDDKHEFGARPIKRAIQKEIEDPLSELLLENLNSDKKHITVKQSSGKTKKLKFEIS